MKIKQGLLLMGALVTAITLCSLSPRQEKDERAKNLKVMPKNSSADEVEKVMHEFREALGVRCNFCHAPSKDDPKRMDFASDANKHKDVARDMMRMTKKINKKYFKGEMQVVTCYTCHKGKAEPLNAVVREEKK